MIMSRFEIDLSEPEKVSTPAKISEPEKVVQKPKRRFRFLRILLVLFFALLVLASLFGFFYWQNVKRTPQYSLALLVKAAREDNADEVARLVDTDAVVDDFVKQVTDQAIELYGRNIPTETIKRFSVAIAPLIPSLKDRVRQEVPRLIREKTKPFESVPWWLIALGADRFVEIRIEGDTAYVKGKLENQEIELKMRREGEVWKIVSVKDERLARQIAEKIGQDIIKLVSQEGLKKASERLGLKGIEDLMKRIQ